MNTYTEPKAPETVPSLAFGMKRQISVHYHAIMSLKSMLLRK
jgi:hypothetical protein